MNCITTIATLLEKDPLGLLKEQVSVLEEQINIQDGAIMELGEVVSTLAG